MVERKLSIDVARRTLAKNAIYDDVRCAYGGNALATCSGRSTFSIQFAVHIVTYHNYTSYFSHSRWPVRCGMLLFAASFLLLFAFTKTRSSPSLAYIKMPFVELESFTHTPTHARCAYRINLFNELLDSSSSEMTIYVLINQ